MSTTQRKARKRAGIPFTKPQKTPTVAPAPSWLTAWRPDRLRSAPRGLGLISGAEILARLVARPR